MIDRATYQRLLNTHGRRVATRAFVAEQSPEQRDWTSFYACYGDERRLPENERCRTGVIHDFDPMGWTQLYENHPYEKSSIINIRTEGQSEYWFDQLVEARKFWGNWVIRFIYESLVRGKSIEAYDAIADDRGDFVAVEDGAQFCGWFPEWRGWAAWSASVTDEELTTLGEVFSWLFAQARDEQQTRDPWPEPGTSEAEALRAKLRGIDRQEPSQEIKK